LLGSSSRSAAAAPATRMKINPHTGRPVVDLGTRHMSDDELRALLTLRGFPDVEKALAIAKRESGGWAAAVVDTSGMSPDELRSYWGKNVAAGKPIAPEVSVGLFQINTLAHPQYNADALKDPQLNADAAFALSQGGTSWQAWGEVRSSDAAARE
jgi:Lysozyme like domain